MEDCQHFYMRVGFHLEIGFSKIENDGIDLLLVHIKL
jgi:hypothetical protein